MALLWFLDSPRVGPYLYFSFFHYNGTIDEVAVYAAVLPETHIVQHFNGGDTGLEIG
ncbi:MAG: hypothetical protein ABFS43_06025 [Thermodesulfobacteriota bacterium]